MPLLVAFAITIVAFGSALTEQAASSDVAGGWRGRLRIHDRLFVDDTGAAVLPLCAHFGEAFSAWIRRPDDVDGQLQQIRSAGYDCIRFWDNLGEYSEAWRGKEVSPFSWTNAEGVTVQSTPEYYVKLERFLALVKQRGLTVHHSRGDLGRGTPAVPLARVVEHSRMVAKIYDRVGWDVLALYEGNNEDFQNGNFGPSGLLRIVDPLKARGALVASSCAAECSEEKADVEAYSRNFSVRYYHGRRDGTAADRLRRKFTSGYDRPRGAPYLGWEGEPIGPSHETGPGVTINQTEDVEEIALLHAMTFFGGKSAATYMSQHGVFWGGPIHRQAGFVVTPRMRAVLKRFAPDVMRWNLYHGAHRQAVLRSPGGYFGDAGVRTGPARLDQAVSADRRRVVAMIYGGDGPARLRNELPCAARVSVIAPLTDEQLHIEPIQLARGAEYELEYRVGRLLLAECSDEQ
jgi:hypothetical protein